MCACTTRPRARAPRAPLKVMWLRQCRNLCVTMVSLSPQTTVWGLSGCGEPGGGVLGPRMALESRAARRERQLVRARGGPVAALAGPRLRRAQFGGFLRCVFSPVLFGLFPFSPRPLEEIGGRRVLTPIMPATRLPPPHCS